MEIIIIIISLIFTVLAVIIAIADVNAKNKAFLSRQKHKDCYMGKKVLHKLSGKIFLIADIRHKYLSIFPYTTLDFDVLCRDSSDIVKLFNHKELVLAQN